MRIRAPTMKPGTRVYVPQFQAFATIGEELPARLCQNGEPHWRLYEFGAFAKRSEFLTLDEPGVPSTENKA